MRKILKDKELGNPGPPRRRKGKMERVADLFIVLGLLMIGVLAWVYRDMFGS